MGLFSKIKKGFKKVVSKIGKGIKKTVKKVGKFMDKIGIVGQIGLALVLPGIGSMMGSLAGGMMSSSIGFVKGAGQLLNAAVNIGTKATSMFKSVTEGVGKVIGDVVGATLNKIPGAADLIKGVTGGGVDISSKTFAGAWKTTQNAISDVAAKGGDLFSMGTLRDPNKYFVQSAIESGEAALAGTEGPSTWDDSKMDSLFVTDDAEQMLAEARGPSSWDDSKLDFLNSTPKEMLEPTPAPVVQEAAKRRGAAIARQGAEAAATATPAENLGMGPADFYEKAIETDPVLQPSEPTAIKGRGTRKQMSLLEAGKEVLSAYQQQGTAAEEAYADQYAADTSGIYYGTPIEADQLPVVYQQFEADPMLMQSYAYGAGAAYNNYKKLFGSIYPGAAA